MRLGPWSMRGGGGRGEAGGACAPGPGLKGVTARTELIGEASRVLTWRGPRSQRALWLTQEGTKTTVCQQDYRSVDVTFLGSRAQRAEVTADGCASVLVNLLVFLHPSVNS